MSHMIKYALIDKYIKYMIKSKTIHENKKIKYT